MAFFRLIDDTPAVFREWLRLVAVYRISGVQVHDARLVAAMNVHTLTHIVTLNGNDFRPYSGITVVTPTQIAL